ncbi:MAG: hypothetical protein ABI330_02200 [Caldimonas sp.]|nr:hypothetical protein [Pseudomonadota bacterium]
MQYPLAILATCIAIYLSAQAEIRWYPLPHDVHLWLDVSIGLFVFFGVLKLFSKKRSALD